MKWGKFISYTSDVIMLMFVAIFFGAVLFTALIVWQDSSQLPSFVELVKDVVMLAIGGYWGRIALTHYQTLKGGHKVVKDFISADDMETLDDEEMEEIEDETDS